MARLHFRRAALRPICASFFAFFLTLSSASGASEPLCVLDDALPASWRPAAGLERTAPWSRRETSDAEYAARAGLDELEAFFAQHPAAVPALGADAVESVIDAAYGASNMPALRNTARNLARRNLTRLLTPYLFRETGAADCKEWPTLVPLAIHAHALLRADDRRLRTMVRLANSAYRACGSLQAALGYDYRNRLAETLSIDEVWDLAMWSITFTDAQLVPGLEVPVEARDLPPALWRFLARYPLAGARTYADGAKDERFYNTAYLATHLAYIPTGYGRHPITIADAPWLYRFLRENFYAVLDMGELDLTAEFVDLFREYGCTESNDRQLRDGTRYLLKLFHMSGGRWMAHREPNEPEATGDYNIVHKAWTGMAAVRARVPEPATPGTYGGIVRQWLGRAN